MLKSSRNSTSRSRGLTCGLVATLVLVLMSASAYAGDNDFKLHRFLSCRDGTVRMSVFAVSDGFAAAGFCWDMARHAWTRTCS